MAKTAKNVISIALAEIGYLEKQSNKNLDSKTANAGYKNYNKYARDMDAIPDFYNGLKNGFDWCAIFVAWCFMQAFGAEKAMKLLRLPIRSAGASCTYLAGRFRQAGRLFRTPEVGDLVLFTKNSGRTFYHIGIVTKVDGTRIYTVEGNTSGKSGIVANGGGVFQKTYIVSDSMRFARPEYDAAPEAAPVPKKEIGVEVWTKKDEKGRILDIALKADHGSIWYQVHTINGNRWLPKVTGFDKTDFINGYAGNHTPIDAIRVYYETPENEPYKQARYAVRTEKTGTRWLPDQVDDYSKNGMDGYAGNLGEAITEFRWRVEGE